MYLSCSTRPNVILIKIRQCIYSFSTATRAQRACTNAITFLVVHSIFSYSMRCEFTFPPRIFQWMFFVLAFCRRKQAFIRLFYFMSLHNPHRGRRMSVSHCFFPIPIITNLIWTNMRFRMDSREFSIRIFYSLNVALFRIVRPRCDRACVSVRGKSYPAGASLTSFVLHLAFHRAETELMRREKKNKIK